MSLCEMALSSKIQRRSQAREIHIPTELVTEILTRLPAKTLMKFKCVSKLWASLIRSQYFSNRFRMVSSQQRLYMCFWDDINGCKDDRKSVILSLVPHATNPSSFVVDQELTIPWLGSYNLQSFCGFLCSSDSKSPRIYNPSTRQLVTLPDTSPYCLGHNMFYYFGHDPVNDQYKVICSKLRTTTIRVNRMPEPACRRIRSCIPDKPMFRRVRRIPLFGEISSRVPETTFRTVRGLEKQWVLVLNPGASWKEMDPISDHVPISKLGLSINGKIYYLAFTDMSNYVVVSFHIESETFEKIQAPRVKGGFKKGTLIEYGGEVAVFDHTHLTDQGKVELWVLKDAGNKEWSKKTLDLQPSQLHLVHNIYFEVKGTSQSGKVLLIPRDLHFPFHILCYDLLNDDMTKIDINGIRDHWFDKKATKRCSSLMYMDQGESILYLGDLN